MQVDGFIDKDDDSKQFDEWTRVFRNPDQAPGTHGPLIRGDPERAAEAIRSKEAVPLLKRDATLKSPLNNPFWCLIPSDP